MTQLLLIRHGQTDFNDEGRLQGQLDVPLNARGVEQARRMAQALKGAQIHAIYSSDLQRARATARELAEVTGLPVRIDPRLREVHLGEWQGKLAKDVQTAESDIYWQRRKYPAVVAPPGGETAIQVQERLLAAINDIVERHPAETAAIVSHGFAIAVTLAYFRDIPISQVWSLVPENGQIHVVEVDQLPVFNNDYQA